LATRVFPDRWKVSYVTPIFKKGRRNNVEDYRGVAILSAIPKRFELLVYRGMYNDLKPLMSINQHGFMKNRLLVGVCIFRAEFNLRTAIRLIPSIRIFQWLLIVSPNLLSVVDLITPRYPTRGTEFLRIDFHRTNYGIQEPLSSAMRQFNEVVGLFDFSLHRDQFLNRLTL
jgi:hypothetical protein